MKISTGARNAAVDAVAALLNSGGYIEIRTGAAPTNPGDADSGTLLARLDLSSTAFGGASGGTATANTVSDDIDVDNTGTAAHFRAKDSGDVVVLQGSAGTSGTDLVLNTTAFVAGGTAKITSLTLTQPQ